MGDEFLAHLEDYHGSVRNASSSAWNLLYYTLVDHKLPISTVSFTETGKPYFVGSSIHVSLSHSKGVCAVAIADQSVGVDIEQCRDNYNPHLIQRTLTAKEEELFDGDYTRLWCRKEAVAKMTGQGITGYPDYIDTTKFNFQEELIEYEGQKYWIVVTTHDMIKASNSGGKF